jgi:hypothetical protein
MSTSRCAKNIFRFSSLPNSAEPLMILLLKPVVKIHVMMDEQGAAKVQIQYYARVKFVSAVAVGVLTGGLSTLVGAGTFANHVSEARDFFARLWFMIEQLTGESYHQTQSMAQTVIVDSPQPAPMVQQTTTTYGNYGPMFATTVPTQTTSMTYNASHLYSAPAPLPPAPQPTHMSYYTQTASSPYPVVPPAQSAFNSMDFGMMPPPPPSMMMGPPPPLPPRQYSSSWQQQSSSTSSYSGWHPQ